MTKRAEGRGAKPSQMTLEEARQMCLDHVTVPVWPHGGRAFGLSRHSTYLAAREGKLPVIRVGSRVMMATAVIARMLGIDTQEAA